MLFTAETQQPRAHYVYAYSSDIHNVAANVLLTQQIFCVLFFPVNFTILGLAVDTGLATKIHAKALSSK